MIELKFAEEYKEIEELLNAAITYAKLKTHYEFRELLEHGENIVTYNAGFNYCEKDVYIVICFKNDEITSIRGNYSDIEHVGELGYPKEVRDSCFTKNPKQFLKTFKKIYEWITID